MCNQLISATHIHMYVLTDMGVCTVALIVSPTIYFVNRCEHSPTKMSHAWKYIAHQPTYWAIH